MIKVPYDIVRDKIKEQAKITDDELDSRINAKIDKLSGLISREGAAHIIANELGIELYEQASGRLKVKNILTGMRNVEIVGKVQQVFEAREFKTETRTGKVGSFIVGDETGTIRVVLWGSQADKLQELENGKVIKIKSGYVKDNNGRKELHLGDQGVIELNPEGEDVGEVKKFTSVRKNIRELVEEMNDVEVLGTIVQTYDIKFFDVCPECNKRTIVKEEGGVCPQHGTVKPVDSYVFNLVLDDGTGNIRTAFFRKQIERLLGKTPEEISEFKSSPEKFEAVKHDLLGRQIKIVGRVNKNAMFDRIELVAQLVFPNPDPEEEIKRLEGMRKEAPVPDNSEKRPMFSIAPETEEKETVVSSRDLE